VIQTLFPNNGAVFQDDYAPIHTAGTLQSWLGEHEVELQNLPLPAQSPHLNIMELLCSFEDYSEEQISTSSISEGT
jgi:hypothetical protein